MRLFWALVPPADVIATIDAGVTPWRRRMPELRWTDPAGWHVTLAFLGRVDEAVVDPLVEAVRAAVAERAPALVRLDAQAAAAGDRVLWLPVADEAALRPVADAVRQACHPIAAADDRHPWRGHLTLARRPRRADPAAVRTAAAGLRLAQAVAWTAATAVLLRSRTGPSGAAYTPVAEVSLGG